MSIRKVTTKTGETKWEVRVHEAGRGSARISRRFDRKTDAEVFMNKFEHEKRERENSPFIRIRG